MKEMSVDKQYDEKDECKEIYIKSERTNLREIAFVL